MKQLADSRKAFSFDLPYYGDASSIDDEFPPGVVFKENKSLATIRDVLLPKLLAGEISIGEAGRKMEEVA
ncbi:MAG: hypothetical protein OEV42_07985 [Deltaproteobacteria bacterium]|nr:hypothetical protein [Deltaproteobacteria bacterium]